MNPKELSQFPLGDKNDAFAKYFVGQSYLHMLSTQQIAIANVTFEPGAVTTGTFTAPKVAEDKFYWLLQAMVITKNGVKRPENFIPVM